MHLLSLKKKKVQPPAGTRVKGGGSQRSQWEATSKWFPFLFCLTDPGPAVEFSTNFTAFTRKRFLSRLVSEQWHLLLSRQTQASSSPPRRDECQEPQVSLNIGPCRGIRGGERAGVTEKVWDTGAGVCRGGVEGRRCLITQPWTARAHSQLTRLCGFFDCATGGPLAGLQDGDGVADWGLRELGAESNRVTAPRRIFYFGEGNQVRERPVWLGPVLFGYFLKQGVFSSPVMTPANQLGKDRQAMPLCGNVAGTLVQGGFACVPCQLRRPFPLPVRALAREGSNTPCLLAKRQARQAGSEPLRSLQ